MASAVFITDTKGKVIICRDYRGDAPLSCAQKFATYVQEKEEIDQFPVFTEDGVTFAYVQCNDLYLMGVSTRNCNVVMFFQFLYRILDTFKKYFGEIRQPRSGSHECAGDPREPVPLWTRCRNSPLEFNRQVVATSCSL